MKTTIQFEDCGQDFLEWDLDTKGFVVESRPFQTSVWKGARVVEMEVGKCPVIVKANLNGPMELRYKILGIVRSREKPWKKGVGRVRK